MKTDRRDGERLARALCAGDLTPVWVLDESHQALRDLFGAREAAKADQLRARHRLSKYLLRHGRRPAVKMKPWTQHYLDWIRREVKFEHYARQVALEQYLEEVSHQAPRTARHRLHSRYLRLLGRGKTKQQVTTAVARELIGFAWAIGKTVEARRAA